MAVYTTFGYNQREDRVWIDCAAWPQRIWLTRRMTGAIMQLAVGALESEHAASPVTPPGSVSERAAAEHDASINRPRPGDPARVLQTGREPSDDPALRSALLCTQFSLVAGDGQAEMVLVTAAGEHRLRLARLDLHRWLHGLQMVLKPTGWADWPALPEWLTRSYLPPALSSVLESARIAADPGPEPGSGQAAPPLPSPPRGD